MATEDNTKKTIGRAERVAFPDFGLQDIPARIDTGAKTSSIWANEIVADRDTLRVLFFGEDVPYYTGRHIVFDTFETTAISTSTGEVQKRYKVRLLVKIKGKKIRAWFTLADRSTQVYPVLIGRNVLLGKFVVDVKKGKVLKQEEQRRTETLQSKIDKPSEEES